MNGEENLSFRSLYVVIVVVLCLSVWSGYWSAFFPYRTIILRELEYTPSEASQTIFIEGIFLTVVGVGGSILLLIASYYSGKDYRLTGASALHLFVILLISIVVGNLTGYTIRQIEYPEYPILNISFFFDAIGVLRSYIVWAFLGILAGNYRREIESKVVAFMEE